MPNITDNDRREMIAHYERGMTLREIAGFYDRSHEGVRQVLIAAGVKLKPKHKPYDRSPAKKGVNK